MEIAVYPIKPVPPTPDQVCGVCLHFKPADREPAVGHRYGHCVLQIAMAREASAFYPQISTYDGSSRCTIVSSPAGVPAFVSKEAPHEAA